MTSSTVVVVWFLSATFQMMTLWGVWRLRQHARLLRRRGTAFLSQLLRPVCLFSLSFLWEPPTQFPMLLLNPATAQKKTTFTTSNGIFSRHQVPLDSQQQQIPFCTRRIADSCLYGGRCVTFSSSGQCSSRQKWKFNERSTSWCILIRFELRILYRLEVY